MLELFSTPVDESDEACKGRYYRYLEAAFIGSKGRLVMQQELRPLKRISCPGCATCGGLDDDLSEGFADSRGRFLEFDDDLESGDIVSLVLVEDGRDWETGLVDDWHYRVTKQQTQDIPDNKEDIK